MDISYNHYQMFNADWNCKQKTHLPLIALASKQPALSKTVNYLWGCQILGSSTTTAGPLRTIHYCWGSCSYAWPKSHAAPPSYYTGYQVSGGDLNRKVPLKSTTEFVQPLGCEKNMPKPSEWLKKYSPELFSASTLYLKLLWTRSLLRIQTTVFYGFSKRIHLY